MWRLFAFHLFVLSHGYHLRVCVSTCSHHNHRIRMRDIIFKRIAQSSLPIHKDSRVHVHVKRKCTNQYETDVFLWNKEDEDKNTTVQTSNAHDAMDAIYRTILCS